MYQVGNQGSSFKIISSPKVKLSIHNKIYTFGVHGVEKIKKVQNLRASIENFEEAFTANL